MAFASKDKDPDRLYAFAAFVRDSDSVAELQRVFQSDTVTDTIVNTGGVDEAIAWLQKHGRSPQRLMVDISGSSRALDDLDRLADACEPSVQVFVVGDRNDVGLYRNLLVRGVNEYLVKPLSADLVRRVVMGDHASARRGRHGKCVCIMGTRGGVGTTSIAVHLARTLVKGGVRRRVVYVDLNVYDGCGAGMLGRPGGSGLLDLLGNVDRLDQQYLERSLAEADTDLRVLAAELEYADEFSPAPGALGSLLQALSQYFHYVVVDMPRRSGPLVSEALAQAALVCLVADPSVHSARTLARLARFVESRPNPPTVLPILNHGLPASRHQVQDKDFEQAVAMPLRANIPYDVKAPVLAENLAQSVAENSIFGRGVKEIAALVTGETHATAKQSWWRRARQARSKP